MITGAGFSFRTRQRIFFVALGMQKHREIAANRFVTETLEIFWCCAHNAPVPLLDGQAKLFVPNRTTDKVNFHAAILSCMRSDCP